jgi:hypothetical protein
MTEVGFDKKAHILSVMYAYREEYDWAQAIFDSYDVALPLAFVYHNNIVTGLSEEGKESIEACFDNIDKTLNLTPERVDEIILAGIADKEIDYVEISVDEETP